MKKGMTRLMVGGMVALLMLLSACDNDPDNTAEYPGPTPTETAEIIETAVAPPLSPSNSPPNLVSISQFPVAVIESASAQRPAHIAVEMAGFNLSRLSWLIGRYSQECIRLVAMDVIAPDTAEPDEASWQDGVHHLEFSWPAFGHFLSDGEQGGYVFIQMTEAGNLIRGQFRSAATGEVVEANLVVDPTRSQLIGLQTISGESLPAIAGDSFQLVVQCLESDGSIRSVPGVELVLPENGQLFLEQQPTASGDYFLQLTAANSEKTVSSTTNFPVNNDSLVPDQQVYLDTGTGFQFLYPTGWQLPQVEDNRIVTADSSGETTLTITTNSELGGKTPSDLKSQALAQFGDVPTLFEDQIAIGDTGALWTAYGYTGQDGPHTGILLTFIQNSVGYIVDLDGLETAEAQTISLMNDLAANWLFRPDIIAPRAMEWTSAAVDSLTMPVRANYYQETLDNGWQRFTIGDGASFMAVRTEALGGNDLADRLDHWQEVIQRGADNMTMSEPYAFPLADREWTKIDFAYTGLDDLLLNGFLMVSEVDGQVVIFWVEIPPDRYEEQSAIFLLSAAGIG